MYVSVQPSAESTVLIFMMLSGLPLFVSVFLYMMQGRSAGFYFVLCISFVLGVGTFFVGGSASVEGNELALRGVITSTELKTTDVVWEPLENPDRLKSRTRGTGAPGFSSGWFKSNTGRKVYVLRTSSDLVWLSTSLDYDILLDRDVFTALKSAAEVDG